MVQKKKANIKSTPTWHSTSNKQQDSTQTPSEHFRILVATCSDYVPVAAIVANSDSPMDDVIVSPPSTKHTHHKNTAIATERLNVAMLAVSAFASMGNKNTNNNAKDVDDDGYGDDDDQKLPARQEKNKKDDDDDDDDKNKNGMDKEYNDGCDDEKLSAHCGCMSSICEGVDDEECEIDALFGTGMDEEKLNDNNVVDDNDDVVDDDQSGAHKGEGKDDADDEGEYDGKDGVDNKHEYNGKVSDLDPCSLFLHSKEDTDALMAFFADDLNYDDGGQIEPAIRINNE
jgi:hypothetical protein